MDNENKELKQDGEIIDAEVEPELDEQLKAQFAELNDLHGRASGLITNLDKYKRQALEKEERKATSLEELADLAESFVESFIQGQNKIWGEVNRTAASTEGLACHVEDVEKVLRLLVSIAAGNHESQAEADLKAEVYDLRAEVNREVADRVKMSKRVGSLEDALSESTKKFEQLETELDIEKSHTADLVRQGADIHKKLEGRIEQLTAEQDKAQNYSDNRLQAVSEALARERAEVAELQKHLDECRGDARKRRHRIEELEKTVADLGGAVQS